MGVVTRAKKRRLEEERQEDHIGRLPDGVLGDIVSLLPTKDGARTQVLSSRWRQLWRSAPLNIDLHGDPTIPRREISRILSSHRGRPGRRFAIDMGYGERGDRKDDAAETLDGWLRSPALDHLQELEFHLGHAGWEFPPPVLPLSTSAHRFFRTLRAASFGGCGGFDNAGALHLPLLKQLTLRNVTISESSLHALLTTGCPVLHSLLLLDNNCCPQLQIVSASLRSIGVRSDWRYHRLQHLVIQDAPCLERLLFFIAKWMDISVISAPRLDVLGKLSGNFPNLEFGNKFFQRSHTVSLDVVCNVKVLALSDLNPTLDEIIDLVKCSPRLETLYIESGLHDVRCRRDRNLVGTNDIRLKKIVFTNYRGKMSHLKIAKFFVLNARLLESLRLELKDGNINKEWVEEQHRLLQIEKRASRSARFDFVPRKFFCGSLMKCLWAEQVHDLSTTDPFHRLHV